MKKTRLGQCALIDRFTKVIIPHFWLVKDLPLLLLFWLIGLPTVAAFPVHYCKKCRHFGCPMNKANPGIGL